MSMTLEQLRIFVAVAQQEHFTRAAERLQISQSTVSAAIAALEREFKVVLFDRSHRHVELTDAGNVLLTEAERILARVDLTSRRMEDLTELRSGQVSIAASQTVGNYWLPPVLNSFRSNFPGVALDIWVGNSTQAEKAVLTGSADLAIVEQNPIDNRLNLEVVGTDTLVLVVGPHHDWYQRGTVEWSELRATEWVFRETGSGTRALFEDVLHANGIEASTLEVALVLRSGEGVRNAVTNSKNAAVMSNLVAEVAIAAGLLRQLGPISIARNYYVLTAPSRPETRAVAAFLHHLREISARNTTIGNRLASTLVTEIDS
jgi:DNA-binding transcriptional LysR family regulator